LRDSDPTKYVEERILRPLAKYPTLRALMPAVALLGSFDKATFCSVSDAGDFDFAWRVLGEQEWVSEQGRFLEIEPWLVVPLRKYYFLPKNAGQLEGPRARACKHLRAFTLGHAGKSDLDARHLDAALRLLTQTDVKEAIRWWQELEAEAAR